MDLNNYRPERISMDRIQLILASLCVAVVSFCPAVVTAQFNPANTLPPPLPPDTDPNSLLDYGQLALPAPPSAAGHDLSLQPNVLDTYVPQDSTPIIESLDEPVSEISPIGEQHQVWYERYPWMWFPLNGWTNSIELGLNGSDGNSQTTSFQAGADLQRITDLYTFAIDLDYQRTQASGLQTQNNGRLNVDYDRLLGGSSWTAFAKSGLEYDEFKAFDLRLNLNAGLGYYWLRNDNSTLITRFGAGTSREFGGPNEEWVPEAVFGYEASHQLTARQKLKGKLDYFPDWTDFNNYRLVSDVSWEILLDGVDNLSLKLSATNRYDSTPEGAKPNDLFYAALLLWKF